MCPNGRRADADPDSLGRRTPRYRKAAEVHDNSSHDDEDLNLRYSQFCELEAVIADIEIEDLTRDELVALLEVFERMASRRGEQDRTNVLDYPRHHSARGTRDGWAMFKDKVRCERERLGQLIGAEPARPLPANVTALGERRGATEGQ